MPAGFGWFPKVWRTCAAGGDARPPFEQELRRTRATGSEEHREPMTNGFRDMDFRFFNGRRGLRCRICGEARRSSPRIQSGGSTVAWIADRHAAHAPSILHGTQEPDVALHTVD